MSVLERSEKVHFSKNNKSLDLHWGKQPHIVYFLSVPCASTPRYDMRLLCLCVCTGGVQERSSNEASQQGATGGESQSWQSTVRQFSTEEDKTALKSARFFTFVLSKNKPLVLLWLLYQSVVALKWILHGSEAGTSSRQTILLLFGGLVKASKLGFILPCKSDCHLMFGIAQFVTQFTQVKKKMFW